MSDLTRRVGLTMAKLAVLTGAAVPLAGIGPLTATGSASAAMLAPAHKGAYSVRLDAHGNPVPFTVSASGFTAGEPVVVEVCDGTSPGTDSAWSPMVDCDETTSPVAVQANSKGVATFALHGQSEVLLFRGASPNSMFNCLAPADVQAGATPKKGMGNAVAKAPAAYPAAGDAGADSYQPKPQAPNPSLPSWTNCQLRISTTNAQATTDQQFLTLRLGGPAAPVAKAGAGPTRSSGSSGSSGSSTLSVAVPVAAAVVIAGAGGMLVERRRRRARVAS